ncbi:threonine/serine exporter [Soehngenia longivitae]|uniref:Threonine/serine exporter n=1 Tax=Soehngenia longivitae TaxID=2562294 RepID=A0A4Z0D2C2_9FIRM|nr:threonine/serine exporter family protein [Soehngenia longivitae]TFZ39891.1 threonine/serine exporter [Soehngenia longivitae]
MNFILQVILSFFSIFGFAIIFNIPRRSIFLASINGMIGWIVFFYIQKFSTNFILPPLIGSLIVGLIGEILAIYHKQPATLFIIPGIIPFVPGYGIYYTMFHILNNDLSNALSTGVESIFVAIAIACGVVVATSLTRFIRPYLERLLN